MAPSTPAQTAITALRDLAEQVENAETLDQVSDLVLPYFDPGNGILHHVTSVMWAAAEHAHANLAVFRDDDPAYALWHRLAAAAETLGDIRDDTSTTPRMLPLIDPVIPEPTPVQRAALATSPGRATVPATGASPSTQAPAQPTATPRPVRNR
jgi:hypothetical protein